MPIPDDVRAAAERLRIDDYADIRDWSPPSIGEREYQDLKIICDAYLREHPADDDEPVMED